MWHQIWQGAEELNHAVKSLKDLSPLLPQLRLFLQFLDSVLEEPNFKMNLLILELYGVLIDRLRQKVKPHLRIICSSLLRQSNSLLNLPGHFQTLGTHTVPFSGIS